VGEWLFVCFALAFGSGCAVAGARGSHADGNDGGTGSGGSFCAATGICSNDAGLEDCGTINYSVESSPSQIRFLSQPECTVQVPNWSVDDGGFDAWTPPTTQNYDCPAGNIRLHVRDMWSDVAAAGGEPSLSDITGRPTVVNVFDTQNGWTEYSATEDTAGCDWYSVCLPANVTSVVLEAMGNSNGCVTSPRSGTFDLGSVSGTAGEAGAPASVYLYYTGTSASLASDYTTAKVGAGAFDLTGSSAGVPGSVCDQDAGVPGPPSGTITVYVRWPWGSPSATGFAGTNCEGVKIPGFDTPPYPTSLKVQGLQGSCGDLAATLEFQDGYCPWYVVHVPTSAWSAGPPSIQFGYPSFTSLYTPNITLPALSAIPSSNEIWIAYYGPPDNAPTEGTACNDYSTNPDSYHVYDTNPGPGYANCGGTGSVNIDPCEPPTPAGYSTVHFRYLWAGQKTFTFFPKPEFMPTWIILRITGSANDTVTCFREADRPWFNCPVPNADFGTTTSWVAADITHNPEWNTVVPRPFPGTPGEYWIRWNYGKPDLDGIFAPVDTQPAGNTTVPTFQTFSYYPDGTGGDWSATGHWNDSACAPKPPPTPPTCGYSGWFPYSATGYAYPFGASLASVYPNSSQVQDALNTFLCQRYEIWRTNYVETQNLVCGTGTARVKTDPPQTVSEGQGYGIAISAAIGDKPTFDALWNFTRHFLSQAGDKYCGGLMGWMWDGTVACRPLDSPCDPAVESCSGNEDSAFDGDVDIAIGLVFAARQWPEYTSAAVQWLLKMECEVNSVYDGKFNYPAPGDTWDKNCQNYPGQPCGFTPGNLGSVFLNYDPPGYFRVFGDFLAANLDPGKYSAAERQQHHDFWYKTAQTVYAMVESCYDQAGVAPGLSQDKGTYTAPCSEAVDNYNWSRFSWRLGVDAAWFGNDASLPEAQPGSSSHYPPLSQMAAKINNIQDFYAKFYVNNPPEPNANQFSTICQNLTPSGTVTGCDPGYGHNSYFVNTAMCPFATFFDDSGQTTAAIRQAALEEAVSTTLENDRYYQESIGVYTLLFLTGNFPNPMAVP
jgi:hypothetical protein